MKKHDRKSIRLPKYDYAQAGAYFVTICVDGRECVLGRVVGGDFEASDFGEIANSEILATNGNFQFVDINHWCIMPNHMHMIVEIHEASGRGEVTSPLHSDSKVTQPTLGQIIASYKYHSTKAINQMLGTPGVRFWQRNYYERVIRTQSEFEAIYDYIQGNPLNWEQDEEYRPQ